MSHTHNAVHIWFSGTMSRTDRAANDPIFMSHHAYIDSIFEMWIRKDQRLVYDGKFFDKKTNTSRIITFFVICGILSINLLCLWFSVGLQKLMMSSDGIDYNLKENNDRAQILSKAQLTRATSQQIISLKFSFSRAGFLNHQHALQINNFY